MNRLITILLLGSAACADLDPATLLKRDRVLGAKVTVDNDPARAWPAPGEHATVTWVTASPDSPATFSWMLAACPAATSSGIPICAGPPFSVSESTGPTPVLSLEVPADLVTPSIVVTGAICASGTPAVDENLLASCDDGSRADLVSQHVFIANAGATNHNPDLAAAPFTIANAAWDAGDNCAAVVEAGSAKTLVGVTFDASDRETFVALDGAAREELQLSAFTTAGEIVQQHTYVEADDERVASPVAFEWEPPGSDIPEGGLRVKFHFVVRDLRGGLDATTRELCVE